MYVDMPAPAMSPAAVGAATERAAAFQVADEIGLYLAAGTEVAAVAGAM